MAGKPGSGRKRQSKWQDPTTATVMRMAQERRSLTDEPTKVTKQAPVKPRKPQARSTTPGSAARKRPAKTPPRNVPALAGKMLISLLSVVVLAVSGYAFVGLSEFDGFESVDVIAGAEEGDSGPPPADGSRDILLVGMDSRTDAQGNTLPKELRNKFTVGDDNGEFNTDTMMLIHIPNDGSKAMALSLPRDSYVEIADEYGTHKLNSAYGRAKRVVMEELQTAGETDQKKIKKLSDAAGAKLLIKTVENLTGRTIDNYASVNLLGFYEITKAVGGVEVCLKQAVNDVKSGAEFRAGKQTIQGVRALQFVRQRYGLPRGDLDRVVRQQVFMAGLARKVISAGTLSSPRRLSDLAAALKKSVVLNKGWDVLDFAKQLSDLTGDNMQFDTIPVVGDVRNEEGWVIEVDPLEVQAYLAEHSSAVKGQKQDPAAPNPDNAAITVDVLNGTQVTGQAASVQAALAELKFTAGVVGDTEPQTITTVQYAPGEQASGDKVAASLPVSPQVQEDPNVPPGKVIVLIGADYPSGGGGDTVGGGNAPADDVTGGGSQPQGGEEEGEASDEEADDKPITASGLRCVH